MTNYRDALTGQWTTTADAAARPAETVAETVPTRHEAPDVAELRRLLDALPGFGLKHLHGGPGGESYIALIDEGGMPLSDSDFDAVLFFAEIAALEVPRLLDRLAHMTEARDAARAEVERLTAKLDAEADEPHPDRPNCTTVGGKGVRVTATDLETGESGSVVIDDDYVLICAGDHYQSEVRRHANGTTALTVKVRKHLAALDVTRLGDLVRKVGATAE